MFVWHSLRHSSFHRELNGDVWEGTRTTRIVHFIARLVAAGHGPDVRGLKIVQHVSVRVHLLEVHFKAIEDPRPKSENKKNDESTHNSFCFLNFVFIQFML